MHISKSDIKLLRSLSQKKFREIEGKFIVEGWRPVKDALNAGIQLDTVAVTPKYLENPDYRSLLDEIEKRRITLKELSEIELHQVSDTVHAQGVIAIAHQRKTTLGNVLSTGPSLIVYADRIADPGNLGSIVRTCDWFGVDALLLSEGCVELYNEKVVRSTAGSIFHIPIIEQLESEHVLPQLKETGFSIIATSGDSKINYTGIEYKKMNVLVFGSEANGVRQDLRHLADEVVCIPQTGKAESLNVSVSCGIMLANLRNKH